MAFVTVKINVRAPTAEGLFLRYELTAHRAGVGYYVAAVHKIGGATTIVDIRRHESLRRTAYTTAPYREIRQAAEAAIRADNEPH